MSGAYEAAREIYFSCNVDTEQVLKKMQDISLSLHCWQGDDVGGFEKAGAELDGGGIQVTGNFPGKAGTLEELRADLEMVMGLLPGKQRLNLHASYGDFSGGKADRNRIEAKHFLSWVDWGKDKEVKLDFNSTLFSHPMARDGYTLSHRDADVREFWIEHAARCREISAYMGEAQGAPCIHNIWVPDGSKDLPVDRDGFRTRLKESLDTVLKQKLDPGFMLDALESKLFGIGSEAFVVASHEFSWGYAQSRNLLLCLDMGHFHPTESVADKISSWFQFNDELLLHVSRPMRWDSDHVVILNDDVLQLMQELVRADALEKTWIGLDFFDGTINRIGAYALGARSAMKALMAALLEPREKLLEYDREGNWFARLALLEEMKTLPLGAVWEELCRRSGVPGDGKLIDEVMQYENDVLSRRG